MVRHQKGHKNSKGESAEWVIISHKDGHVISSHKTKEEAEKHLKDIQKFKHMNEDSFEHGLSARDIHLLNTGRKPYWAKSVTNIGKRPQQVRTANTPSENAMRRVTEPNYRPAETESEFMKRKRLDTLMNQRIADMLKTKTDKEMLVDDRCITILNGDKKIMIYPHGMEYVIRIINSATDHKAITVKTINDIIEVINNMDESFIEWKKKQKLDEGIFEIGSLPAYNDVDKGTCDKEWKLNGDIKDLIDELNSTYKSYYSKLKDYVNGHIPDAEWNDFKKNYLASMRIIARGLIETSKK